jgi:HK97 family phage major capsid protein
MLTYARGLGAIMELQETIEDLNDAFGEFKAKQAGQVDALKAEVGELKQQCNDERAAREALEEDIAAGGTVGRKHREPEYKTYYTPEGPAYELPSQVKLADVAELRPQQRAEVSLDRWLAAAIAGEKCQDREALRYARELSQKQMVTTSTGILIPQQYIDQWIDLLRAKMVLNRAGITTLAMDSKTVNMSALTGDPTASWHTEAGSISAANPTFAARTLTASTLVTRCQGSLELSQDSPDFGAQLTSAMASAMAAELDRVGLEGSGTPPEPTGILNTSGRSSQTSVSTLTDYEEIISGIGALLSANCDLEQVSRFALMSPGSWTAYENLVTGISSDKTQLPRPKAIEDMQFLVTSNIAGDLTASPAVDTTIYLGDFRDLTLGIRREASIEILKLTTYASNLLLEFVGYLRADYVVRRPASFHTIEDVAA